MPGLDRLGRFASRRELDALRGALKPGERVLHVVEAKHGRRGVLAATDRRILFATAGFLRRKAAEWRYVAVADVAMLKSIDEAALTLVLRSGAPAVFTNVRKAHAEAFVEAVRKRPPGPDDPLDFTPAELRPKSEAQLKVERLQRMLRKGSITKAEYERRLRTLED